MEIIFLSYLTVLLALAIVLLLIFLVYSKYVAPYSAFPSSWAILKLLPHFVTGKIPENTTRSSYFFQIGVNECKKYLTEGFCVFWAPNPHVAIFNEEAVKMLSNERAGSNKGQKYEFFEEFLGTGLLTSERNLNRKQRKMFQPAFNAPALKNYASAFNKYSIRLVQRLMIVANEPVDVISYLKVCSMENLLVTLFGIKAVDLLDDEIEKFVKLLDEITDLVSSSMIHPGMHWKCMRSFFQFGRELKKTFKGLQAVSKNVLLKMKEAALKANTEEPIIGDDESCRPVCKSLGELLVKYNLQDPSFTKKDLEDEVNTFLFTGYENIAQAAMWCLFLLGNHQDIQDQVYNEVEHLMEKGKNLTFEDTRALTYMDCIIKETLRLYPTVPVYSRCLEKDVQCGKYTIPQGANIAFFPYLLHRNPNLYTNPEEFNPERFRGDTGKNPWSYIPFAEGVRNCIGKKYAVCQMKIMLSHILHNFQITSLQGVEDIQTGWEIVLTPSQPIQLRFTPRNEIAHQE